MADKDFVPLPESRFAEWLIRPIARNRATYARVAVAALFINIFGLVTALFTMTVYDRVLPNNAFESLLALSIGLGILIVFDFALKLLRSYFVDHAGAQIDREMGGEAFDQVLAMQLEGRTASTGQLAGTMRELETLREFFASATLVAIVDVPFILLTLLVVWLIGGSLVWVPAVMVPLVVIVGLLTQPAMHRLAAKTMGQSLWKQSVLVETIGALETVKASGAGGLLARRWDEALVEHAQSSLRQRLLAAIGTTFAGSATTISYAGVVIVGVFLIADNQLTMGGLIACSILAGRAIAPLAQISQLVSRLSATRSAYQQIDTIMAARRDGPEGDALRLGRPRGKIELRKVSFAYPGTDEKAIDTVSLTLEPGEHVALLGRVGSGKSTLARLVLGLYTAQEGVILIDGTDLRQLDPVSYRTAIGSVLQETVLLTGTVRENISLDRAHIDDEEVVRAADVSGTHQFMGQITNGYDRKLADRGEGLSGGQRQSIALARALAGRPPIIVMDEPTSAMDTQTEEGLIQRLQEEFQGRTLLLVTHRPSLLKLVDRVIVMHEGKVAADGPRDAVLQRLTQTKAA